MKAESHAERMERFVRAGLYLVTSQRFSGGRSTLDVVQAALDAGVRLIQLREKELSCRDLTRLAHEVRAMTRKAGALLLINDRLDVALAVGADGVHLGQEDLPIPDARRLAPDLILGASTHNVEEAVRAQEEGASYINIGPLFPTQTKQEAGVFLGMDGLRRVAAVTRVPFSVMGGIQAAHIPELIAAGASAIAVITAVTAAPDVRAAAREMLVRIGSCRQGRAPRP